MRRLAIASVLSSILLCGAAAAAADAPAHIGRYTSTPQDTQAINQVIEDFKVGTTWRG